jgi:hypothetical protein
MFDFWSIPYLVGKGIAIDTLKPWMGIAQELIVSGLGGELPNTAAAEARLVSLLQARTADERPVVIA